MSLTVMIGGNFHWLCVVSQFENRAVVTRSREPGVPICLAKSMSFEHDR